MGVNSLPKTVTQQRRGCDLNPGPSAPESSTLTTRHCVIKLATSKLFDARENKFMFSVFASVTFLTSLFSRVLLFVFVEFNINRPKYQLHLLSTALVK